jgi:hypothetical protein
VRMFKKKEKKLPTFKIRCDILVKHIYHGPPASILIEYDGRERVLYEKDTFSVHLEAN